MGPRRILELAIAGMLLFVGTAAADLGSPAGFPFEFTPEADLPFYLTFRAEGLPLRESAKYAISYLRKWRVKKFTAPTEEITYFGDQRKLRQFLDHEPGIPDRSAGVHLGMVGDIMWVRNQWNRFVTPEVLEYMGHFDAAVGNLETPIARSLHVPPTLPDYRYYNSDPALIRSFNRPSGGNIFSALSTANNHSLDFYDQGALETCQFLDEEHIAHSGTAKKGERRFTTFMSKGIKFGYYAATWGLNDPERMKNTQIQLNYMPGIAPERPEPADLEEVRTVLEQMKQDGCEFRIVSLHWGFEYEYYPSPKIMQVGRDVVAAGADLIVGTHPHVQQPVEFCFLNGYEKRYEGAPGAADLASLKPGTGCVLSTHDGHPRKALILYSMGNFTTTMWSAITEIGLIDDIHVFRKDGGVDWTGLHSQFVFNHVPQLVSFGHGKKRSLSLIGQEPTPFPDINGKWLGPQKDLTPLGYLRKHLGLE